MPGKPNSIDEYLASVKPDRRATLEKLRAAIHQILPDVEECIAYGMPAFRYNGEVVAGFLATVEGCSYFPFSGSTLATLADDVVDYRQTKGSLHFDANRALSIALVRKLLKARLAESEGMKSKKRATRSKPSRSEQNLKEIPARTRAKKSRA